MCFSATASFAISSVLTVGGVGCVLKAKKSERMLAAVPLIFAFQQAIEGLQWLVEKPSLQSEILAYGFLFFAFLWWPVYIPASILALEKNPKRRKWLKVFTTIGALVSLYLLGILLTQNMNLRVGAHIEYGVPVLAGGIGAVVYVAVVCGSTALSSNPILRLFSIAAFLSALLSLAFFEPYFISVWCFAAAVISSIVFLYFFKSYKKR